MVTDGLMTTGEVARVLGCSRQHVVDLCSSGRLPWVSVGTHRRVRRVDVDRFLGLGLTRDQERSLWLHHAVAGQMVFRPGEVLAQAASTLDRLRALHAAGPVTGAWLEWGRILDAGVPRVLEALTSREGWAVELRQNTPFAGVLTVQERSAVLEAFREYWRRTAVA